MFLKDFQMNLFEKKGVKKTESPKTDADTQQKSNQNVHYLSLKLYVEPG